MALCGFNQQMLDGEQDFAEGLWRQLLIRSETENKSLVDTLKLEIDEMEQFERFLRTNKDIEQVEDILGIVYFARSLYRQCLIGGGTEEVYKANVLKSVDRQYQMDQYYYEELRPNLGPIDGLKKLAVYLENHPLS